MSRILVLSSLLALLVFGCSSLTSTQRAARATALQTVRLGGCPRDQVRVSRGSEHFRVDVCGHPVNVDCHWTAGMTICHAVE